MTKKELVKYVSDKIMITERDSGLIFDVMFEGIKEALERGDTVKIRDFGTFFIQERAPRRAYSPIDQSPIEVPAKKAVKFRVSKRLNEKVK